VRRNRLSLLTAAAALLLSAVAFPTPQAGAAGDGYGWVWADQPGHRLGEWYRPNTDYQYSSPGAGRDNQVRHDGPGTYTVYFDGVLRAGVGHVTAYGLDNHARCKIAGRAPGINGEYLVVHCYDFGGALLDSMFTASFTNLRTRDHPFGYRASYDGAVVQHNSSYGSVTHVRESAGTYRVAFKGLPPRGTVLVTATGPTAAWCSSGRDTIEDDLYLVVWVICFSPVDGSRADTEFDLTYAAGGSVVGDTAGTVSGYARVTSRPSLPIAYQFPEPRWRLENPERGVWVLTPWQPIDRGIFQITVDDASPTTCVTSHWHDSLTVQCYDRAGAPLDLSFFASYLAPRLSTTRDGGTP
jgi:hypothetical protein